MFSIFMKGHSFRARVIFAAAVSVYFFFLFKRAALVFIFGALLTGSSCVVSHNVWIVTCEQIF